jgi:type IV pilus assembly protein PilO
MIRLLLQIIHENRLLLVLAMVLATVCGALWFGTLQQALLVTERHAIWQDKRRQAAQHDETRLAETFKRTQEQLDELWSGIPFRHEFPRVISELYDAMALYGATPGPLQYKPVTSSLDGLIAYTLNCTASGAYPGLKRLIAELERLDGVSTVTATSFSNQKGTPDSVELKLELTVYLREGQP